ncbi:MAG: phosphatase PAP2 family protein [Deltaproteobacteria bacterium]|nr:phosphatase PAP2 family protein [Deltaproteobacteria bacterium]
MLDTILKWDTALFYLLNGVLINPFLDAVMPFITNKTNFLWLIIISWFAIFMLTGSKGKRIALVILLVILISDQTAGLMKHIFHRPRPCTVLTDIRLLVGCGASYSFPSNHAANIFAVMTYLSYHYRRLSPIFLIIAFLVAYSRIYVGVHYPMDVLGGIFLGLIISSVIIITERWIIARWRDKTSCNTENIS